MGFHYSRVSMEWTNGMDRWWLSCADRRWIGRGHDGDLVWSYQWHSTSANLFGRTVHFLQNQSSYSKKAVEWINGRIGVNQSMEGSVVRQEAMAIGPRSVEAYVGDNPLSILSFFCCNVMRMGQEMNLDCNRKDARTAGEICVAVGFLLVQRPIGTPYHSSIQ